MTKRIEIQYNLLVIRRWNLTILIIILAFVVGFGLGYLYRDRFSFWILRNTSNRNEPNIAQDIFRTEVTDLLRPETAEEAANTVGAYSFTGRVYAFTGTILTVEQPDDSTDTLDAIDFTVSDATRYESAKGIVDSNGIPDTETNLITSGEISAGDIVTVYTLENMRESEVYQATVVQKIIDSNVEVTE